MKSIYQNFETIVAKLSLQLALVIMSTCFLANTCIAKDDTDYVKARGGNIHYTIQTGKNIVTKDIALTDNSYVYTGAESNIVIADPNDQFHIGIVKKGAFAISEICKQNNARNQSTGYTLANYLIYNAKTKTMDAVPFDNGFAKIDNSKPGVCIVHFMYTLKDVVKVTIVKLEGSATFESQTTSMHK